MKTKIYNYNFNGQSFKVKLVQVTKFTESKLGIHISYGSLISILRKGLSFAEKVATPLAIVDHPAHFFTNDVNVFSYRHKPKCVYIILDLQKVLDKGIEIYYDHFSLGDFTSYYKGLDGKIPIIEKPTKKNLRTINRKNMLVLKDIPVDCIHSIFYEEKQYKLGVDKIPLSVIKKYERDI